MTGEDHDKLTKDVRTKKEWQSRGRLPGLFNFLLFFSAHFSRCLQRTICSSLDGEVIC